MYGPSLVGRPEEGTRNASGLGGGGERASCWGTRLGWWGDAPREGGGDDMDVRWYAGDNGWSRTVGDLGGGLKKTCGDPARI